MDQFPEQSNLHDLPSGPSAAFPRQPHLGLQVGAGFCGMRSVIMQLQLHMASPPMQRVVTDGSWTISSAGPILSDSPYNGEVYDARLETPGWSSLGYKLPVDRAWAAVINYTLALGLLATAKT